MIHLRACRLRPALVAVMLLVAMGSAAASQLTATLRTDRFVVRYDAEDPYLAKVVADTAQEELERISRKLGYDASRDDPFTLSVYRSHLDFIEAGGLKERKFTVGTARVSDQSIAVDASGAFVTAREVLAHEITHAVVFRILGPSSPLLPLWFNEGLAKLESEDYSDADDMIVADAAADGTLIPLPTLAEEFPAKRDSLAYAESFSAVRFLISKHGSSAPRRLLHELARTGSFGEAMVSVTGQTPDEFVSAWELSVSRRYGVLRFARIAGALGGVLMAALAVVAFVIRRKRMREAAIAWEREQFEESLRRQLGNDWWR